MQAQQPPPGDAVVVSASSHPPPSRSALYRARKRHGEPIGQHRDAEELAAIANKPAQQRSSAEKKALRNQKAYAQRKQKQALLAKATVAPDAIPATAAPVAVVEQPVATSSAFLSAPFHSSSESVSNASSSGAAAAAPTRATSPASLTEPHLLRCATQFVAKLKDKQRCLPFTFDPKHRDALQTAVGQRVLQDVAPAEAHGASTASAPPLCESDLQLLHSCLTMLQRWPCWMQQQWLAMTTKKIAKSEVSVLEFVGEACL